MTRCSPLHCLRFAEAPRARSCRSIPSRSCCSACSSSSCSARCSSVFWLKNRSAAWFGWWSACLLLGSVTSVLYMLRGADSLVSVGIGNAALIASFACCWQGARDVRPPPAAVEPGRAGAAVVARHRPAAVVHDQRAVPDRAVVGPDRAVAVHVGGGVLARPRRAAAVALAGDRDLRLVRAVLCRPHRPDRSWRRFRSARCRWSRGWLGAFNLAMFAHTILLSVLLVSLSKERLELDQRTKAQTDPLTGALNRRAFMLRGERLLQRHAYEKAPLCLVFLDIDQFKAFNDRFGHSGGDDVLVELRRPGQRLHPADRFPVPHRRRGVLLPAAVHHHRSGLPGRRAHPLSSSSRP